MPFVSVASDPRSVAPFLISTVGPMTRLPNASRTIVRTDVEGGTAALVVAHGAELPDGAHAL